MVSPDIDLNPVTPNPHELATEQHDPELVAKISDLRAFLFDCDDLIVERIPSAIQLKFELVSMWSKANDEERRAIAESYEALLDPAAAPELLEQHKLRVAKHAEEMFPEDPSKFGQAVRDYVHEHYDEGIRDAAIKTLTGGNPQVWWNNYSEFDKEAELKFGIPQHLMMRPSPGVFEILEAARKADLKTGIVSNSKGERLIRRLGILGVDLNEAFDCVISAADLGQEYRKPDPRALIKAMEIMGVESSEDGTFAAAYFGNAKHDIQAAVNARFSIPIVVTPNGRGDFSDVTTPHLRFNSLSEFNALFATQTPELPSEETSK